MPESETETETKPSSSQSVFTTPDPTDENPDEEGPPRSNLDRARAATDQLGDRRHQAALDTGTVRSPGGHRAACRRAAWTDHGPQAQRLAHQHPDWPPERIADALDRRSVPASESRHPALVASRQPPPDDEPPGNYDTGIAAARTAIEEANRKATG